MNGMTKFQKLGYCCESLVTGILLNRKKTAEKLNIILI